MGESDPPPPPILPEGVSFGQAPGGVTVLNIRFDEDEWQDRWAKVPHAVLRHPSTGATVTLIGTAHVSKAAAEETRELILRERPDVVVIELDPNRLNALVKDSQTASPAAAAAARVESKLDLMFKPSRWIPLAGALGYALVGAVLGTTPGAEFLAAIDAAKEVGAEVVLGDLDMKVTTSRVWKRWFSRAAQEAYKAESRSVDLGEDLRKESSEGSDADLDDILRSTEDLQIELRDGTNMSIPVKFRLPIEARRLMYEAGCGSEPAELDDVEKSGFKVGFLHVDAPTVEDIAKVRRCGEKVINLVRSEEYLARNSLAVAGFQNHAIQKTLVADRDLVLAHSMHRPAGGERVKKVVGVVGAGHIPGIKRHWDSLSTDESRDAYNEALNPIPADASDSRPAWQGPGVFLVGGVAAYLWYKRRNRPSPEAARGLGLKVPVLVGAYFGAMALAGSYVACSAMQYMGSVAQRAERVASTGEAQGLLAKRRNELRSKRWSDVDEYGNLRSPKLEVRATNAVGAYRDVSADKKYLFR